MNGQVNEKYSDILRELDNIPDGALRTYSHEILGSGMFVKLSDRYDLVYSRTHMPNELYSSIGTKDRAHLCRFRREDGADDNFYMPVQLTQRMMSLARSAIKGLEVPLCGEYVESDAT